MKENEEVFDKVTGRDRGGRGRLLKESDDAFSEVGMIIASHKDRASRA